MNLHEMTKTKYLPSWDEAREGKERTPELMQLKCRKGYGHIYVHSPTHLAVSCDKRSTSSAVPVRLLLAQPYVKVIQDAERGFNATFPAAKLDEIAEFWPIRRRKASFGVSTPFGGAK